MIKTLCSLLTLATIFTACDGPSVVEVKKRDATGPVVYGGTFKMSQDEKYQSLFPPSVIDIHSSNILNHIYDGLVKFHPRSMEVIPSIAKSWTVDETGLVYTFKLKKGVHFHDDPCFSDGSGREVTAEDVIYTYTFLCSDRPENSHFSNMFKDRVVGANAFFDGEAESVEGFKALDPYTIEITLLQKSNSFIYWLANPSASILAKEAIAKYNHAAKVGTGPYRYTSAGEPNKELILVRNESYHLLDSFGNQLPYIDTIRYSFINSKNHQLQNFRAGDLDFINGLPSEKIKEVVKEQIADFSNVPPKFILGRSPEMLTQYYEFNMASPVFKDVRVRKAFNLAINKQKVYHDILVEEAYGPGKNGITPPSFPGYDIDQIEGYSYDPEQAQKLLAMAGYPNGEGFETITIELNSGGTRNSRVAFEIQKQLSEVLGVSVDIEVVPFGQKLEDARYGRAHIFRSSWVADYPSPESFLSIFYGKNVPNDPLKPSFPNTMRYKNAEFDALYEQALIAPTKEESYKLFLEAEKIMINDAPVMPLWYSENYRLLQARVRNFYSNPMNYMDLTEVYFKERVEQVKGEGS